MNISFIGHLSDETSDPTFIHHIGPFNSNLHLAGIWSLGYHPVQEMSTVDLINWLVG